MELTDKELDTLVPFYTNLIPHELTTLTSTMVALEAKYILTIYDRQPKLLQSSVFRYWLHLAPLGHSLMRRQSSLSLTLACVRRGMTSEALEFIKSLPNESLTELLVCSDAVVRKHVKWRLSCAGGNGT